MLNFVTTKDEKVAEQLRNSGFYEIKDTTGAFVFVNKIFSFENSKIDKSKLRFTNKICI